MGLFYAGESGDCPASNLSKPEMAHTHHEHDHHHGHAHQHGHDHDHGHGHHHHAPTDFNRAFAIGISLNVLFVLIESFYGWKINSLALLADAGHNLSDVAGLVLAWAGTLLTVTSPSRIHCCKREREYSGKSLAKVASNRIPARAGGMRTTRGSDKSL